MALTTLSDLSREILSEEDMRKIQEKFGIEPSTLKTIFRREWLGYVQKINPVPAEEFVSFILSLMPLSASDVTKIREGFIKSIDTRKNALPYIYAETNFKLKSEKLSALALCEDNFPRRIRLKKTVTLEDVSEIVKKHYKRSNGEIKFCGKIKRYYYHDRLDKLTVFDTEGKEIDIKYFRDEPYASFYLEAPQSAGLNPSHKKKKAAGSPDKKTPLLPQEKQMNRNEKEEKRKYDEARKGLSKDEIMALDLENEIKQKIEKLADSICADKFPEEYDFMYENGVDTKERNKGINPMSQEYIDKIKKKQDDLGVKQLAENGMPVSRDTYNLCLEEAKLQIYSDLSLKRPPAKACVFCNKTINDVGGKRIIAQQFRGVTLSKEKTEGDNKDYSRQYIEIFSEPTVFMVFWGEKELWTESAIAAAKNEYLSGKRPWFCQICGKRKCSECGSPINYPVGSDILYGNGYSPHVPTISGDPGCSNPDCKKYIKWRPRLTKHITKKSSRHKKRTVEIAPKTLDTTK